jgi:XTP/dITP diphosphohydrolase
MSVPILIATANAAKVREFRQMLGDGEHAWTDLTAHPEIPAAEETGHTFRANASIKATWYAARLQTWAMADDSGLAVDALDGQPGVLSARWAQLNHAGGGDQDNNSLLLTQLENVPDQRRTGRFVCVLALADPHGRIVLTVQGSLEGQILRAPRGANGFGYDPLFLVPQVGKTTAELSPRQKHAISHRGKALSRMREIMRVIGAR